MSPTSGGVDFHEPADALEVAEHVEGRGDRAGLAGGALDGLLLDDVDVPEPSAPLLLTEAGLPGAAEAGVLPLRRAVLAQEPHERLGGRGAGGAIHDLDAD